MGKADGLFWTTRLCIELLMRYREIINCFGCGNPNKLATKTHEHLKGDGVAFETPHERWRKTR